MAKHNASPVTVDGSRRFMGTHAGCGGQVIYQTSTSMGWLYCEKCRSNSNFGTAPEVIRSA